MTAPVKLGLALLISALVLDWGTKWAVLKVLQIPVQGPMALTGFLNLVYVENRGISFGLLSSDAQLGRWLLIGFALAVTIFLVLWLFRAENRVLGAGLGLVAGGALGNVYDRVVYGAVVDFIDFHGWGYHWYAFNVADAAICVGVVLLLWDGLFNGDDKAATPGGR